MEKLKRAKNLYKALKKDSESVFFGSEQITNNYVKKARKSNYEKDKYFLTLYNSIGEIKKNTARTYNSHSYSLCRKKSNIDRSTLYSFGGPLNCCMQI